MKYKELIGQMTLEEKASLMSGENFWNTKAIERLGIPSIMLTDGPHGLRKQGGKADNLGLHKSLPATCFPTAATLANSWDTALLESIGECLGKEAAGADVSVLLGPGLNIKRSPLCGRNFEYFSEDPYLSGKLAAAMVRGIQSQGVAACPKHYAVNSQELRRMVINEVVDERALREIYLEGFRYAMQDGGAKTIMTSYNRVNGEYANENPHLLQDILYGEWGFDGVVVTDWGGENDRVEGLVAGNQLEMPSTAGLTDREIVAAVKDGTLNEALLDERVDSLLSLVYEMQPTLGKGKQFTEEAHHQAARDAARRSAVLLKNDKKQLPLAPKSRAAVIGDFAKNVRYQGAGSSLINPTKLECALEELKKEDLEMIGYQPGFKRLGGKSATKKRRAVKLAQQADIVLLFLGLDEGSEAEGVDRTHMRLPQNQIELLEAVRAVNENIVVVLAGGAPVEMPWANDVPAILHAYLGGQAGGGAVADILMGRHNPCGKLAESYPVSYADVPSAPCFPGEQLSAEHRESIYVGYRYFDSVNKDVTWPFGHGLSYTTFEYTDLSIQGREVRFTVQNTGDIAGAEIAQVYISKPESDIFRAQKELKGFTKIFLQPGEQQAVVVKLDDHAFRYYNTEVCEWVEEPGEYMILVGASSRDIRLQANTVIKGQDVPNPYKKALLEHYYSADVHHISDAEFETLLGHPLPPGKWDTKKPLGYTDTVGQGQYKKGFGRFLYRFVRFARNVCFFFGKPVAANNVMFAMNLPYRQMARLSGGRIDMSMLDGILVMANGQFWKGLKQVRHARRDKKKREKVQKNGG